MRPTAVNTRTSIGARILQPHVSGKIKDNRKNEIQGHSRDQRIEIYRSIHGPEKCPLLTTRPRQM